MKKKLPKAVLGCVVALAAASLGAIYYQNSQVPNLGVTDGQLKALSSKPNCVSTQAKDASKKVSTLAFKDNEEDTLSALKQACQAYGGVQVKEESSDYLYVVFTTPMMRFKDDAEFWLDSDNREVHFRSAARAGYSDMGMNRKRYEAISKTYSAI